MIYCRRHITVLRRCTEYTGKRDCLDMRLLNVWEGTAQLSQFEK